jgi:S-methylmethionine-dependent homocysteine/selenocysteine methylase
VGMIEQLDRRIADGEVILIDGGTGTELEARGVPMNHAAWCGMANLDHPDVVRQIHEDYIQAGADVIITNTYPTSRAGLEAAGLGDRVGEINRRAVELALQARDRAADRPIVVAGSMSIWGVHDQLRGDDDVDRARVLEVYCEQASILADSGVDLLTLETFSSTWVEGLHAAVETGLPVWLGFWVGLDEHGGATAFMAERPLEEELREVLRPGVTAVNVMHSNIDAVLPGLDVIAREWDGVRGAYPHVGEFKRPRWVFRDIEPEDFATQAIGWVEHGAQLVGGCCGIRPRHIAAMRERLPRRSVTR